MCSTVYPVALIFISVAEDDSLHYLHLILPVTILDTISKSGTTNCDSAVNLVMNVLFLYIVSKKCEDWFLDISHISLQIILVFQALVWNIICVIRIMQ